MGAKLEDNGTWTAQLWYRDTRGRRRHKLKRGFKTEEEALEWEESFQKDPEENMSMKFSQFVKLYKEDMAGRLRQTTWESKEHMLKKKILPYFGDMSMDEIDTLDVIRWQNEMMSELGPKGDGYADTYLRSVDNQLNAVFNHAVRYYGLPRNPCTRADKMGSKKTDEMKFWTKDDYLRFADTVMDKPMSFIGFEILYWCGLRVGEMLALTPADLDFGRGTLSVTKSYQRIHGRDVITDPKTEKSKRLVAMPKFLMDELKEYIDTEGIGEHERIVPMTKTFMWHEMRRGCAKIGMKPIRIHDLRHSHVSLLIDMGFSAVAIADRMGHESASITFRYAHMFPSKQAEMVSALEAEGRRS